MYSFVNIVFQILVISLLCLLLPSIFFLSRYRDKQQDLAGLLVTIVHKYMGRLVSSLFNPSSCLPGRLEPGVLRPYQHVLQRGGRRDPTHHTVTSCFHFITTVPVKKSQKTRYILDPGSFVNQRKSFLGPATGWGRNQ